LLSSTSTLVKKPIIDPALCIFLASVLPPQSLAQYLINPTFYFLKRW